MCKKIIILVLLILVVIVLIKIFKKRENYDGQTPEPLCGYIPDESTVDYIDCVERCYKSPNCDIDSCVTICKEHRDSDVKYDPQTGSIKCSVSDTEITGVNIEDCIDRCQKNGDLGCKLYKNNKTEYNDREFVWSNSIADYDSKCSTTVSTGTQYLADKSNDDFKSCSPCVKKCKECKDHGKCPWIDCGKPGEPECIDSSTGISQQDIDNINLIIYGIPNANQVTIFWEVNGIKHAFSKFIVMYSPKLSTTNEYPPVKWKEITYNPSPDVENSVIINGLLNDVKYNFVINGIINIGEDKVIKHSNTIEITPSEPNVVDYSFNNPNSLKTINSSSENFLKNILGKTIEISL